MKTAAPKRLTNEGVGDVAPPLHHLPRVWNFTGRRWNEGTKTSTYYSSSKINHKGDLCQEASTDRNSVSEPLVVNQSGLIFTHGVQFSKSTACENTCIMSLWLWREHHKALKITRGWHEALILSYSLLCFVSRSPILWTWNTQMPSYAFIKGAIPNNSFSKQTGSSSSPG